ncbi:hypothetical protein Tcan_07288 [Toxocara canis]|uniref:Uncharacterized protein n=1 Tax=Toxocara canis TaxID=6265 RepID=A0A0B2W4N3_TOXCA|nr:hypothetical protein Tcan_07288 [Toxocara canis]
MEGGSNVDASLTVLLFVTHSLLTAELRSELTATIHTSSGLLSRFGKFIVSFETLVTMVSLSVCYYLSFQHFTASIFALRTLLKAALRLAEKSPNNYNILLVYGKAIGN